MAGEWKVKFCEDCFHAFDVLVKGKRTPDICDECRVERARARNRRWVTRRTQERAAARAA